MRIMKNSNNVTIFADDQCPPVNNVRSGAMYYPYGHGRGGEYSDSCCTVGMTTTLFCNSGFRPIGTVGPQAILCGRDLQWFPSGDVYCGRGNE